MVAIEAASYGLPTVAFTTGGVIDAIKSKESGFLITSQNYLEFTAYTIQILKNPSIIQMESCQNFAKKFAWHNLARKFQKVVN